MISIHDDIDDEPLLNIQEDVADNHNGIVDLPDTDPDSDVADNHNGNVNLPDTDLDSDVAASEVEENGYIPIFTELSKQWLLTEVSHRVSKEASNEFWRLSNNLFHQMYEAKAGRGRKIPQYCQVRRKMYKDLVPKVKMEIAYQDKETGEFTIVEDVNTTPVGRFPANTHRRIYEIASVDVSNIFLIIYSCTTSLCLIDQ